MGDQSLVPSATRDRVRGFAVPVARVLGRLGLTPNALTILGFLGTAVAAVAAAGQAWLAAGILVLAFGIFDLFDGALARETGRASAFGAFLDSTLDRTGENLVYAGIAFGCASGDYPFGVGLAGLALATSSIVTYVRARAESIGLHGEVGVAPRPERLVVLAGGLAICGLTGGLTADGNSALAIALGAIALTSSITIVQRIAHVHRQLDRHHPTQHGVQESST
jgi:CDP-diacylglycerol--glycerol-3-phosphate 3-phosphatidyltransferase